MTITEESGCSAPEALLTPSEFAEMVEHAAAHVRVIGRATARRMPIAALERLLREQLDLEIARRVRCTPASCAGCMEAQPRAPFPLTAVPAMASAERDGRAR